MRERGAKKREIQISQPFASCLAFFAFGVCFLRDNEIYKYNSKEFSFNKFLPFRVFSRPLFAHFRVFSPLKIRGLFLYIKEFFLFCRKLSCCLCAVCLLLFAVRTS
jgi:hypothetical protein